MYKQEQEFKKKEKAWLQKKEGDSFTIEAIKNIKNRQAKSTYRVRETKEKYLNRACTSRDSREAIKLLECKFNLKHEEATKVYWQWRKEYINKREVL